MASSESTTDEEERLQLAIPRNQLPVEMKARAQFSVWEFMKNCIGKELTKITMPISFNEPLSFVQRVVEYLEYSEFLFKAAKSEDPVQRLEYIAALVVSGASSNWDRFTKPFNPLQGETYEMDRTRDLGYRVVCEQVSHHPPTSAFYAEAADGSWRFHGSVTPKLSFWGKTIDVAPRGCVTIEFPKRNEVYTYQNVVCRVHNILFGKLWVEHCGDVVITNHKTRHRCELKWHVSSWFSSDYHRVTGYIYDANGRKKKALYGKWVDSFYSVPMDSWRRSKRGGRRGRHDSDAEEAAVAEEAAAADGEGDAVRGDGDGESGGGGGLHASQSGRSIHSAASQSDSNSGDGDADGEENPDFSPSRGGDTDLRLPGQARLWRQRLRPEGNERYFCFTAFAASLNDADDPLLMRRLPPTDSRRRPDVRALELGDGQRAQSEKARLEENQRHALKLPGGHEARRLWFRPWLNPYTNKEDWEFTGAYWARDWSKCAEIF